MERLDFGNFVFLTLDSGSTYTVTTVSASTLQRGLVDDGDGSDDGMVVDGGAIGIDLGFPSTSPATLVGVDAEGVAVERDSDGQIFYFTDNVMLNDGDQITLTDQTLDFSAFSTVAAPTQLNYAFLYEVQDNGGGTFEVLTSGAGSLFPAPLLTDDQDGMSDGTISVGQDVSAVAGLIISGTFTILGITPGNEVIINDGGTLYMFSNVSRTIGETVTANESSTTFCFAAGTMISTPDGPCDVERLSIGDLVITEDGSSVPVKWVGHQTLNPRNAAAQHQMVRISAGALGGGLPHTDLTVTADHGMVIDGFVINASALVNHTTIDFVPLRELESSFKVYHVETENHDVILANGAPSETFVDYVTRCHFDNYDEYLALYGAERIIPEMSQPRISSARLLPSHIRRVIGLDEMEDTRVA